MKNIEIGNKTAIYKYENNSSSVMLTATDRKQ